MPRVLTLVLALFIVVGSARADRVDTLIRRLRSPNSKTRLSAALVLGKRHEARAVPGLVRVLRRDRKRSVRLTAAAALGAIAAERARSTAAKNAIRALRYAEKNDKDLRVRKLIKGILVASEPRQAKFKNLFVLVKQPGGKLGGGTKSELRRILANLIQTDGRIRLGLTDSLDDNKQFVLSSKLSSSSVSNRGRTTDLTCKVMVRVSPRTAAGETWRSSESAIATASAKVTGASSASGIARSRDQCAAAAIEAATKRQVIPFLAKQLP